MFVQLEFREIAPGEVEILCNQQLHNCPKREYIRDPGTRFKHYFFEHSLLRAILDSIFGLPGIEQACIEPFIITVHFNQSVSADEIEAAARAGSKKPREVQVG